MKYDFLIVGAGLFGSVCANELKQKGYSCLVIEKRQHIGGNCFTEQVNDIYVHKYGPHIFHTSSKQIWDYITSFDEFEPFQLNVVAHYQNRLYSLPFNMWTFNQMWGVTSPLDAKTIIDSQRFVGAPSNLEEYALSIVGKDIYYKLIYGYTKKQWKTHPKFLPSDIIKRLPLRFTFDNNYFNDNFQGIPKHGYTYIIQQMLMDTDIELNIDYFANQDKYDSMAKCVIYTGPIDKFYNYIYGKLNYRSLFFEEHNINIEDYQGTSVINYTEETIPYTRIVEHKHFLKNPKQKNTIITKEYPIEYTEYTEPMYPINNIENTDIYNKYKELTKINKKYIFGGRLAEYKYYDMHQVIGSALSTIKSI